MEVIKLSPQGEVIIPQSLRGCFKSFQGIN